MKQGDLLQSAQENLTAVLQQVPLLSQSSFLPKRLPGDLSAGFMVLIQPSGPAESFGPTRRLVCELRSAGQPRLAREACLSLMEIVQADQHSYPIFIAPYISPAAAAICKQYKTGYLDLAGNCLLAFDSVFIQKQGFPNPNAATRELRSLYSPKAERILRVLLSSGPRLWRTQQLADTAQVSLGQVASVKKLLADREWIESGPSGFALSGYSSGATHGIRNGSRQDLDDLPPGPIQAAVLPMLKEWARAYRPQRSVTSEFYSLQPIPEIEAKLTAYATAQGKPFAFTGFSGAARLAPAVRYQRATAYIAADVNAIAETLAWKRVNSGPNITLIQPYDEGVFFDTRNIDGAPVVSPIQLYLDLLQSKGRGEEAAAAILAEVIQPLWR